MQIHIHKPHLEVPQAFEEHATTRVEEVLAPFLDWLTRIDLHFKEENAQKGGPNLRCVIEARPRGLDPLTAEHHADELRDAFHGALDKLQRVLAHQHGRRTDSRRSD